jgi:FdrA protein
MMMNKINLRKDGKIKVINLGVKIFYDSLKEQGVEVIHVDWRPPAGGDKELLKLLEMLED